MRSSGMSHRWPIDLLLLGPWCITFELHDGEAKRVNLEQYH